ncbi:MAG: twin-arginine translocase subunit TatC [Thermoflexales bacterium]|nr:twin-arginine translocase subunit TatC [Thermoflexales bacterium]
MAEEPNTDPADAPEEGAMSLLDHLRELRDRLFRAVLALGVGTGIGFFLAEPVLRVLAERIPGQRFIVINPTEGLTNYFTVAVTIGAALAMPVILYQIIAFIMPGLLPRERRWLYIGLPMATLLFLLGMAFSWFLFLPNAIDFLANLLPSVFTAQYRVDETLPFFTNVIFWMGVAFEMPILIFTLAKLNVVSAGVLARQWRYAIVIIAVVSALITPTPDPVNMGLVMLPLLVLYLVSIVLARLARRGATVPAMLDPNEKVREATT